MSKKSSSSDREVAPPSPPRLEGEVWDAHCHLESMARRAKVDFTPDFVTEVMSRAASVGVTRVINVGCAPSEWESALASLAHPDVYAALAVHPTEVNDLTDADYDRLEELLATDKVVAVGETGLDYYWDTTTPALQQEHFRRHIELAKRVGKPLMIHDRDAHEDVLGVLEDQGAPESGVVFHAFSGDAAMAARCAKAGYYLSFPGVVTFANAPELREAAAVVPLDRLLVETDAPFLTPHPYRGRPNAPYLVPHILRQLADLRNMSETEICATIWANGTRLFGVR